MADSESPLYLGLDLSTQSLKAVVIRQDTLEVVCSARVGFDEDLPHHRTVNGVHLGNEGEATSPPLMWVEAMELVLDRLTEQQCPFQRIVGVSGSGQQHGTVYWAKGGEQALKALDKQQQSLTNHFRRAFALDASPIWMDTSTSAECQAMENSIGGPLALAGLTGSRAYERFSAHQILRRFKRDSSLRHRCERISLVSSFACSLLAGKYVDVDFADASGMNLMDIKSHQWHPSLVSFLAQSIGTDPAHLSALLGASPTPSWSVCSVIAPHYVHKYGFDPGCEVVAWSGDNPNSIVGLGLLKEGDMAVSLGTSDTLLAVVREPKALSIGHVMVHPALEGAYFIMLCYSNGDITRKSVRDEFANGDWVDFARLVENHPPGNNSHIGVYLSTNECTPPLDKGPPLRFKVDDSGHAKSEDRFPSPCMDCRAVVEMRALAMHSHLQQIAPSLLQSAAPPSPSRSSPRLLLTGGASSSPAIRQVFADVFQRPVTILDRPDSAALGAAYRALHACEKRKDGEQYGEIGLFDRIGRAGEVTEEPKRESGGLYRMLAGAYGDVEDMLVKERGRVTQQEQRDGK
ncbi:unnamed protein product [Vitrella brassicaformis CCMP3155]|uniref:Xylulose kinase n=3 Tax=Vitrella brassicaformis TaxID=1169539 RepID=A0A0G4FM32_VITBC|nr:unnamed protein product [Vitrella brassicaformis CCMP3155]|mmetsp:Transcript_2528/g.6672  ORF Transcript_2528/g.6672 Transcript_2528/m.6672 type:complete len:574 (+) Transcript_2528:122-1843(+)|eukprot:CEM14872.1 unnamed protein product [Vitrella brassicaformis CCMP3155]